MMMENFMKYLIGIGDAEADLSNEVKYADRVGISYDRTTKFRLNSMKMQHFFHDQKFCPCLLR